MSILYVFLKLFACAQNSDAETLIALLQRRSNLFRLELLFIRRHSFVNLGEELAISLVSDTLNCPTRGLEIRPQVVVSLFLSQSGKG